MEFQHEKFSWKKVLISFLLAFIILYLVISNISLNSLLNSFKTLDFKFYMLGILFFYFSILFKVARWKYLLGIGELFFSWRTSSQGYFLSIFFNCIFPAKMGDLYRAYYFRPHSSKVLGRTFLERVFDVSTLVLLVIIFSLLSLRSFPSSLLTPLKAGIVIALLALIVLLVMQRIRFTRSFLRAFGEGATLGRRNLPGLLMLSLPVWFLEGLRLFSVSIAAGVDIEVGIAIFIALTASLLTAFPTPAGLGAVEAGIAGLLILFGIDKEMAVSIALLDRLISYWSVLLVGGLLYAFKEK